MPMPHPSHGNTVRVNKRTLTATCPRCEKVLAVGLMGAELTEAGQSWCQPPSSPAILDLKKLFTKE